jgi:hypothetical protein
VSALVTAGAGFLLAVLWFDLMFDVQARGRRGEALPGDVAASIAGYYGRVTTGARPMNRLVAAVMVTTLVAIVLQIAGDDGPRWAGWASLVLIGAACAVAATRTVPTAVRLGARAGTPAEQGRMALAVLRQHVVCFALVLGTLVVQLAAY